MKSIVTAQPPVRIGGFGLLFWIFMALFGFSFLGWFWRWGRS
jgi:hypothetical protein